MLRDLIWIKLIKLACLIGVYLILTVLFFSLCSANFPKTRHQCDTLPASFSWADRDFVSPDILLVLCELPRQGKGTEAGRYKTGRCQQG